MAEPLTPTPPDAEPPRQQPTATAQQPRRRARLGLPRARGVPQDFPEAVPWLVNGLRRQRAASIVALLGSWTGAIAAMWVGAGGLVLGLLVGIGVVSNTSVTRGFWSALSHVGSSDLATVLAGLVGAVLGAAVGFGGFFVFLFKHDPIAFTGTVVTGAIISVGLVAGIAHFEGASLRMRGYRHLSRDEVRKLAPHVQAVGAAMQLTEFPRFAMADQPVPGAWTHMQHIVLTTSLMQLLDEGELEAVLAHELHHWRSGDAVGQRVVWACGLPIAVLYNAGVVLSGRSPNARRPELKNPKPVIAFAGWLILWPTWILTRLVIAPLSAATGRRQEYEADAAARAIGRGAQLESALHKLQGFEPPRSGWEAALMTSHPPTELRIDALHGPQPDDADFLEGDLGRMPVRGAGRIARAVAIAFLALLAVGAVQAWRSGSPSKARTPSGETSPTSGQSGGGGTATTAPTTSTTIAAASVEHAAADIGVRYFNAVLDDGALLTFVQQTAIPDYFSQVQADAKQQRQHFVIGGARATGMTATALGCKVDPTSLGHDDTEPAVRMKLHLTGTSGSRDVYITSLVTIRHVGSLWQIITIPTVPSFDIIEPGDLTDSSLPAGFHRCS